MFKFIGIITVILLIAYMTGTLDKVRAATLRGCDYASVQLARTNDGTGAGAQCPGAIVRFVAPHWSDAYLARNV